MFGLTLPGLCVGFKLSVETNIKYIQIRPSKGQISFRCLSQKSGRVNVDKSASGSLRTLSNSRSLNPELSEELLRHESPLWIEKL